MDAVLALHQCTKSSLFLKPWEASFRRGHALFDVAGAVQLCGVRVQFRRGQPASLALPPKHLQSAIKSLSDRALQRGPLPHRVQAQLGAAGAQQGEDKRAGQLVEVRTRTKTELKQ